MLTPGMLEAVGRALYGVSWRASLARDLKLRNEARIADMMAGRREIPDGFPANLLALIIQRQAALRGAARLLSVDPSTDGPSS